MFFRSVRGICQGHQLAVAESCQLLTKALHPKCEYQWEQPFSTTFLNILRSHEIFPQVLRMAHPIDAVECGRCMVLGC